MTAATLNLTALSGIPLVESGDDLARLIAEALTHGGIVPRSGDVIVVAQKIVSKAEGRLVELASVTPSARADAIGVETGKDPRLVELILSESVRVVRTRPDLVIAEHRLGFVAANAGIDQSNVGPDGHGQALLLPVDPDGSAERLRAALEAQYDCSLAVIVSDSFGRAWRRGTIGIALGAAGIPAVRDLRGQPDLFGRPLRTSIVGFADEIAAAASLLMGQGAERAPVVLVRGLTWSEPPNPARDIIRAEVEDLFR